VGLVVAAVVAALLGFFAILPVDLVESYVSKGGAREHALGVGVIALLVTLCYPRSWAWILGLGAVASLATEIVQPFFGRDSQWSDLAADLVGLVIGVGAALLLVLLVRSYKRSR
jgi:VanZ family protein